MHKLGLEIAWHETEAWKQELRSVCELCDGQPHARCSACNHTGKKYPWINDPQAFRPAFDRARWALPGTVSTGVSHCADIRTMGRVLAQMEASATSTASANLVEKIKEGYRQALPGLAGMWLKESSHNTINDLPFHLSNISHMFEWEPCKIETSIMTADSDLDFAPIARTNRQLYIDPIYNQNTRISFSFPCSLAASRDWHRHRSAWPWNMKVLMINKPSKASIQIDSHYAPISEFGKTNMNKYIEMCTKHYLQYLEANDKWTAMLYLPLGTRVQMSASMGLRDFIYMTELRGYTHGANFEYQEQAQSLLQQVRELLHPKLVQHLGLDLKI
jgi:hypothetical protein